MGDDAKVAMDNFLRTKSIMCSKIEECLRPIVPAGASLDLLITIRNGSIAVRPTPLYHGVGWKDKSGGQ